LFVRCLQSVGVSVCLIQHATSSFRWCFPILLNNLHVEDFSNICSYWYEQRFQDRAASTSSSLKSTEAWTVSTTGLSTLHQANTGTGSLNVACLLTDNCDISFVTS
jgi:hypothetical protein